MTVPITVSDFLLNYSDEVKCISERLFEIVKKHMVGMEIIVFEGWKNISFGTGKSRNDDDLICYIAPFNSSVNLGFYRGSDLPDRKNLLKGTGKKLRHIKFRSIDDIDDTYIEEMVINARIEIEKRK